MAGGAQPLRGALAAGGVALALVLALTLGSLWPLTRAAGGAGLGPADLAALRFTLIQALLSAAFSVLGAVPLARALARRRFPLRGPMLALMGAPFLLPAIVAVLGITAIWGRSGLVSQASVALGGPRLDIYGLEGVVLGHVFFNLGLVTRLILQGWAAVPGEHWRLVSQLGMKSGAVFRVIEWPMLREVLPGAFLIVFLLAAASFAVALALGGGPGASTMEVAIYEALRFDFDPGRAALLALMQLGLCAAASLAVLALGRAAGFGPGLGLVPLRPEAGGRSLRLLDGAVIGGAALFLFLPLAALVARGLPALAGLPESVWPAAARSLAVALPSAGLATLLAMMLAGPVAALRAGAARWARVLEAAAMLGLAVSPFVIGTGLFLLLNPVADPFALALPVTVLVNALTSLPFAFRILLPALEAARADYGRLAESLGMAGFVRFRLAYWPFLRRPAGFALGLAAAISMGDLGVIALFAPEGGGTLPLALHRLMAAYRMEAAYGAALLLTGASLALFWIFERGGRVLDRA